MSNKNKSQNAAKKAQINKQQITPAEKIFNKFQDYANVINVKSKYRERIITSYISIAMYLIIIAYGDVLLKNISNPSVAPALVIVCVLFALYNIIKSVMSILAEQSKKHNIVLIVIHSLFIIYFIAQSFMG